MAMLRVVGSVVMVLATATGARAQPICGDANGNAAVTVTDGVRVLRFAAGLAQSCDPRRCDVDGSETVTLTDGVNTLRLAANLSVGALSCPTPEVSDFVDEVEGTGDDEAQLELGLAPIPSSDDQTVTGVEGSVSAPAGGESTFTVSYDTKAGGAALPAANGPALIIAVVTGRDDFRRGFFRLPLTAATGATTFTLRFPPKLGNGTFFLAFATRVGGDVSRYRLFAQRPSGP